MLPSGWQLAQVKVPVVEAPASLNAIRPSRTASGVGSLPTAMVSVIERTSGLATFTTDTVLSSVLST